MCTRSEEGKRTGGRVTTSLDQEEDRRLNSEAPALQRSRDLSQRSRRSS